MDAPVTLLWLEPTPPGAAARTHFDGTMRRLKAEGISATAVLRADDGGKSIFQKLARLLSLVHSARNQNQKGVLLTRWHPFLALVAGKWRRDGGRIVLLVQGNDETVYESYPWFRRLPFARLMVNRSIKAGDHVLVLNDGLKVWVDSVRGPNLTAAQVLPTGVADLFLTSEPPDTNGLERPYALFFGNLARWQGIDYLLSAKDSPAWPRDVDLVVVGDGEMRRAVMDSAGDGLRYLGKINPNELAPLVAGALVTLCPKLDTKSMANTTTPFKILESVAAGVPVIATDIPAQRSMIEAGGYGLLVDLSMPAALARAVATVHDDAELRARLSQRARAARSELSWEYASTILASALARAATDAETR